MFCTLTRLRYSHCWGSQTADRQTACPVMILPWTCERVAENWCNFLSDMMLHNNRPSKPSGAAMGRKCFSPTASASSPYRWSIHDPIMATGTQQLMNKFGWDNRKRQLWRGPSNETLHTFRCFNEHTKAVAANNHRAHLCFFPKGSSECLSS